MTPKRFFSSLCLLVLGFAVVLISLEFGLRLYYHLHQSPPLKKPPKEREVPLVVMCDCPFIYRLNPDHPDISSQGIRDKEYAIPKPRDTWRILVLGDSVPYGDNVPCDSTFSSLLEHRLSKRYGKVEVVNTGVLGYSPFNELHYYLNEGRRFEPDVVVVVFVMNDVANPRLHWGYTGKLIRDIPDDAIPNLDYDRGHVLPILEARRRRSPLRHFALYRYARTRLDRARLKRARYSLHKGKKWPTYITGEDTIPIQVLLDYDSSEWRWLRSMYDQLHRAVASDGARFLLVAFPLAYQLNEDYPYIPQRLMQKYCKENSIPCLDLLPRFRKSNSHKLYVGLNQGRTDIWHPTQAGHEVVAEELAAFLVKLDLLGPSLQ